MKLGKIKKILFFVFFTNLLLTSSYAVDAIQVTPLINLEEISPTFEEEKDELEETKSEGIISTEKKIDTGLSKKNEFGKTYVQLKALDKITAKTSSIKIEIGEKKYFGQLEIKPLKCALSKNQETSDIVAYLQVKDLSMKSNDQVFVFNGWTFASSPTLRPIDHPVYDLWLEGCENI